MKDDPETPGEWQEAVNMAKFLLALDDCRMYGLIEGGPEINRDRAIDLLERGKKLGYDPAPLDQLTKKFLK